MDKINIDCGLDFPAFGKEKKTRNQYIKFKRKTWKYITVDLWRDLKSIVSLSTRTTTKTIN